MTQMIGRALRGVPSGGTNAAYIISFIDNWRDKIAWVNAENIYTQEENDFIDTESNYSPKLFRVISIAKIEEFAQILDETVDTLVFLE